MAAKREVTAGTAGTRAGSLVRINRRTAVAARGAAGIGLAGAAAAKVATASPGHGRAGSRPPSAARPASGGTAPACVLTPEETAGPYYLSYEMVRRDITKAYPGVPLTLRVTVIDATRCAPVTGAALDVWHCNALGEYSGYVSHGIGGATPSVAPAGTALGGGHVNPTDHLTFLRGVQLTDRDGVGEFRTIYPGWYASRAIHIHVKVYVGGGVTRGARYAGGHVAHTGQLYFPEEASEQVARIDPYRINTVARVRNQNDLYFTAGHDSGVLTLTPRRDVPRQGLVGAIVLGMNPSATPAPVAT